MTSPLISVMIPVFNGERYLAEAVQSALDQTLGAYEILVIDDGSTDRSPEIAHAFGRPVRYHRQVHSGQAAARNAGVRLARGNFFAFLDADDLWHERKLEIQTRAMLRSRADMAFTGVEPFASPEPEVPDFSPEFSSFRSRPGYLPSSFLVEKNAFLRIGFFDVEWRRGEFIDWYCRAKEGGLTETLLPEILVRRRIHEANLGKTQAGAGNDYARILKKNLDRQRKVNVR